MPSERGPDWTGAAEAEREATAAYEGGEVDGNGEPVVKEWSYELVYEGDDPDFDGDLPWYVKYNGIQIRAGSKPMLLYRLAEAVALVEDDPGPATYADDSGGVP